MIETNQPLLLLYSCILGFAFGFLYDLLNINVMPQKKNDKFLFIKDFLFMLILSITTFIFLLVVNYGQVRFYILAGETIGFCLYKLLLSNLFTKTLDFIVIILKNIIKFIYRLIFKPLIKLFNKIQFKIKNIKYINKFSQSKSL